MADKPVFVDLIGEATRQNRRRAMPVDVDPMPSATARRIAHVAYAAAAGALAAGDADAVEDQDEVLEVRELGLKRSTSQMKNRRPLGRLFRFSRGSAYQP